MTKRLFLIFSTIIIVIGLSGCGEQPKPVVKQLEHIKPITITIPKNDPLTGKKLPAVDFVRKMYEFSTFKKYHTFHYSSVGSLFCKGLLIKRHKNQMVLDYTNEIIDDDGKRNVSAQNHTVFNMGYLIKGNSVTFYFPTTSKKEQLTLLGSTLYPVGSDNRIYNDVKHIFSKLNTFYISKNFRLQNEVNNKYPVKSIYANFKRILGDYYKEEKLTESEKKNTFSLKVNGKRLPLHIEVFPYREGSKVKYSVNIPYKITQNGSSLTKQDIKKIKSQIIKIIND